MAPTRERQQRAAARARLEREMTARAESARKRRQRNAYIGAGVAVAVLIAGGTWLGLALTGKKKENTAAPAPTGCQWIADDATANPQLKEVGKPATDVPKSGKQTLTLDTSQGVIEIQMDVAAAPCTSASMAYLAAQNYYANTPCFSVTHSPTDGYALLCGDHTGKGTGGAAYTFYQEVTAETITPPSPTASPGPSASPQPSQLSLFKKGTVAMSPGTSGSQFMIFYQDSQVDTASHPYTIVGQVTSGLSTVEAIAKAGTVQNDVGVDVKPKNAVTVQSVTVVDGVTPSTSPSGSPAASPSASAS
jgi:peptidyl-prolyl cis-trans isomerase B (cyclophilin B)